MDKHIDLQSSSKTTKLVVILGRSTEASSVVIDTLKISLFSRTSLFIENTVTQSASFWLSGVNVWLTTLASIPNETIIYYVRENFSFMEKIIKYLLGLTFIAAQM